MYVSPQILILTAEEYDGLSNVSIVSFNGHQWVTTAS